VNTYWGAPSQWGRLRSPAVLNRYYIIVVEEDEVLYEKIVRALGKLGCDHDIRRVSTREELDDELFRLAPDFVICDHARSNWNSFAILRQVRDFQATMPFAVIGGAEAGVEEVLLGSGADACLNHDRLGELAPTVEEMLKRRAAQRNLSVGEIRRWIPRWMGGLRAEVG